MDRREYRQAVRSRAWSDAKAVHTHVHLAWGIGLPLATAVVDFVRERSMGVALSSFSGWLMPLLYGVMTLVVWVLALTIYFRLKAPGRLYLASREQLSATSAALAEARVNIETAQHEHAAEVEGLRRQQSKEIETIRQEHANAIEALRREHESAVLIVTAFTDPLSRILAAHEPTDRLESIYLGRRFAVLSVTNEGHKNLPGIVVTCQFEDGSDECVWSLETGEDFVAGDRSGRNKADLSVGETRLLVVAQAFGEDQLWTRLSTGGPIHELPLRREEIHELPLRRVQDRAVTFINRSGGRVLNLGADVAASVRMKSADVDQTKHFRLWFNQGEPAIQAATAPPPTDQPSSTACG